MTNVRRTCGIVAVASIRFHRIDVINHEKQAVFYHRNVEFFK